MGLSTKKMNDNIRFLLKLRHASKKKRQNMIKKIHKKEMCVLCEVCLNILGNNVPINLYKLKKYKSDIRNMANRKISFSKKKKILIKQRGAGFLSLILPSALTALSEIAAPLIRKIAGK